MNKFDLEKALAGEKVVTRDGEPVTQLVKFDVDSSCCVYGVVKEKLVAYDDVGICLNAAGSYNDLFMAPKKLSGFVNVYDDGRHGTVHKTKTAADEWAEDMPRDCIRLTCIDLSKFEEGHGL